MIGYRRGYNLQSIADISLPSIETFDRVPMSPTKGDDHTSIFYFDSDRDSVTLCDRLGRTTQGDGMQSVELKYGTDYAVLINGKLTDRTRMRIDSVNGLITFTTQLYSRTGFHSDSTPPKPPSQIFNAVSGAHEFVPAKIGEVDYLNDSSVTFTTMSIKNGVSLTNVTTNVTGSVDTVREHIIESSNPSLLWHDGDEYLTKTLVRTEPSDVEGTVDQQLSNVLYNPIITKENGLTTDTSITQDPNGLKVTNTTTNQSGNFYVSSFTTGSLQTTQDAGVDLVWHDGDNFKIEGVINITLPSRNVFSLQRDAVSLNNTIKLTDDGVWHYFCNGIIDSSVASFQDSYITVGSIVRLSFDGGISTTGHRVNAISGNTLRFDDYFEYGTKTRGTKEIKKLVVTHVGRGGTRRHYETSTVAEVFTEAWNVGPSSLTSIMLSFNGTRNISLTGAAVGPKQDDTLLFDSANDFNAQDIKLRLIIENLTTGEQGIVTEVNQHSLRAVLRTQSTVKVKWTVADSYIIHKGTQNVYEDVKGHHISPFEDTPTFVEFLQDVSKNFIISKIREGMIIKNITEGQVGIIRDVTDIRLQAIDRDTKQVVKWKNNDLYLIDGSMESATPENINDAYGPRVEFLYDPNAAPKFTDDTNIGLDILVVNTTTGEQGRIYKITSNKLYARDDNGNNLLWLDKDEYKVIGSINLNAPKVDETLTCCYYRRSQSAIDPYYSERRSQILNNLPTTSILLSTRRLGTPFLNIQ